VFRHYDIGDVESLLRRLATARQAARLAALWCPSVHARVTVRNNAFPTRHNELPAQPLHSSQLRAPR